MTAFMGYFLIFLALFKFLNLRSFVDGFSKYDIIAKKFKVYGYSYPFMEFLFGVSYLYLGNSYILNILMFIVMFISGLSIVKTLLKGDKLNCACLGTHLSVPLGYISLVETFGMGLMSIIMILIT